MAALRCWPTATTAGARKQLKTLQLESGIVGGRGGERLDDAVRLKW